MKNSNRRYHPFLFILCWLVCLPQSTICQTVLNPDSTHFLQDTVIDPLRLDGELVALRVFRDRPISTQQSGSINNDAALEGAAITLIFYDKKSAKEIFRKKFDFNREVYSYLKYNFYKAGSRKYSDSGKLYLDINLSAGGSGSLSEFYFIRRVNGRMDWNQICQAPGELSSILIKNNDQGILLLEAVWNIKENETHFGKHRYRIREFVYTGNGFREKWIGQTVLKYASVDESHPIIRILGDIKTKEPRVVNKINLTNFR